MTTHAQRSDHAQRHKVTRGSIGATHTQRSDHAQRHKVARGGIGATIYSSKLWRRVVLGGYDTSFPVPEWSLQCTYSLSLLLLLVPLPQCVIAAVIWLRSLRAIASMPLVFYFGALQGGIILWCLAQTAGTSDCHVGDDEWLGGSADGGLPPNTRFLIMWPLLFSACWCVVSSRSPPRLRASLSSHHERPSHEVRLPARDAAH